MRVAIFFFFYLATTGISLPYFSQYLNSLGYSGKAIAGLSSVAPVMGMFIPLLWGFVADRTGKHIRLLKLAVAGTALALIPLYFTHSFPGIFAVWVLYASFTAAIPALADTVAVVEARRIGTDYARLRLWGSVSFIIAAFSFGQYLEARGSIKHVPVVMLAVACVAAIVVHILKQPANPPHRIPPSFKDARNLLKNPALFWFFIAGMFHQAGLSPYYLFYGIHLEGKGIGQDIVGWSFALGVGAEVLMLYAFRHVSKRIPLYPMMGACYAISSLRWFLIARVDNGPLMAALQIAHAFSFAFVYAGSIAHLEHNVVEPLRATGRALFQAISQSLGLVLGHWLAGIIFDWHGSSNAFYAAAVLDILAIIPLVISARHTKNALAETSETIEPEPVEPDK